MEIQRLNPPELFDSRPIGFSQMVIAPTGHRTIHLSGQVAWNAERQVIGHDDIYQQVVQSLHNIEIALSYANATLEHVVALRLYIKYSHMNEHAAITRGLLDVFGEHLPCATWIGVPGLANEDFLVEIEPTIIIPA